MNPIYPLLLLSFFISSCNWQNKTDKPENSVSAPKTTPVLQPAMNVLVNDPHFVETSDTISKYGPHNITRNMLQDRNGIIWFATWQGIIRYDGKFFTNVTLKEGLGHFHIFSVLEDKAGNLWFGTINKGLYRYDGKSFTYFTTQDGLAGNSVMCMLEDKTGTIWFGTDGGLSCYNGNRFTSFTRRDGLISDSVYSMVQDKAGKLWIGTESGVCSCYDPSASLRTGGNFFARFTETFPFRHVLGMMKDKAGNIWFGSQGGLYRYDGQSLVNITRDFVSNMFEDKTGNIWFGGDVGCYDGKTITRFKVKEGQSSNSIFCIFEDQSGNLWFGMSDGVRRYDGKPLASGNGNFTGFKEKEPG